jgi:hypothetical protein
MTRALPYAAAFLVLGLAGIGPGLWTGRWSPSADPMTAAARCDDVPMNLGDWEGQAREVNLRELALAEVVGHLYRDYVNRRTGQKVSVLLVCGRPGPISVHTPDVCYRGVGYEIVGGQSKHQIKPVELFTARFSKQGVPPEPLRIFWCWGSSGSWAAPDQPRLTFARAGALYKLYVVRSLPPAEEPLEKDPCLDFLRVLMPELQRCLFPNS